MTIRHALPSELDAIAALVAGLQAYGETHMALFGESRDDIAAEIRAWGPAWHEQSLVAEGERHELVGFVGVEADPELERGWIYGPLVGLPHWDEAAELLLRRALADLLPDGARDLELVGDDENVRLAELARSHGFERRTPSLVLELHRSAASRLPPAEVAPVEPAQHAAVAALHDALFTDTYFSGEQLVDQHVRGEAVVLALVEQGALTGYAAGRLDPAGEGHVDFVGVSEERRSEGRGGRLVAAICAILLQSARSKVALVVYLDNAPALRVYERLGFVEARRVVGYRRRPESPS